MVRANKYRYGGACPGSRRRRPRSLAYGDSTQYPDIPPGSPLRQGFPEDQGCTTGRFEPDSYLGEEAWLDRLYASYRPDVTPAAFAAGTACL